MYVCGCVCVGGGVTCGVVVCRVSEVVELGSSEMFGSCGVVWVIGGNCGEVE
jgi:hypothetical protein